MLSQCVLLLIIGCFCMCVEAFVRWCVGVRVCCSCVIVLACVCVRVFVCWCVDVLMC